MVRVPVATPPAISACWTNRYPVSPLPEPRTVTVSGVRPGPLSLNGNEKLPYWSRAMAANAPGRPGSVQVDCPCVTSSRHEYPSAEPKAPTPGGTEPSARDSSRPSAPCSSGVYIA